VPTKTQLKKKLSRMSVSLQRCNSTIKKRIIDLLKIHPCPLTLGTNVYFSEDVQNQYRVDWLMSHDSKFKSKVLNMIKDIK
jgi:hypothetical protein